MKNTKTERQYAFITVFIFLLFTFVFLLTSCNTTEPPPPKPEKPKVITLKLITKSCTEAFINVSAKDTILPARVTIKRDGKEIMKFYQTKGDTTVVDTGLTAGKTYTYQPLAELNGKEEAGEAIQVTTLDTTSNNFTWKTYTFGDPSSGSSTLNDVAIINDTLIYAVGEIYMNDSTGQPDPFPYNLAKWNGRSWKLIKVPYYYQGQVFYHPIESLFAFGTDDIWFAGNGVIHWDGTKYNPIPIPSTVWGPYQINKIWGLSSENFYIVGNGGNIAHYQNGVWSKIESGTSEDLFDIYSYNGKDIYVAGGNFHDYSGILLDGNDGSFRTVEIGKNIGDLNQLFHPYFDGIAKTVWVSSTGAVYFGGNALYININGKTDEVKTLPGNHGRENVNGQYYGFISQIRGKDENEMIMVGEGNTIRYFNGVRWKQLGLPYDYSSDYTWLAVSIKKDMIVTVGYSRSKAIIMMLRRN